MNDLRAEFGDIDIYLFDQLLRGRITPSMRVLDAGCGSGRNLVYLLRAGYEVYAVDADPAAIDRARATATTLSPEQPAINYRVEPVERLSFADGFFDVVLSSAVLHFARDTGQFRAMLGSMWRVIRLDGLLFCRLASSIGMEHRVEPIGNGRFLLPDGTERYLVDEAMLLEATTELGGELADPLKTTIVHNQRCMTTWVVRKGRASLPHLVTRDRPGSEEQG